MGSSSAMYRHEYQKYAPKISIMADTIVIDGNIYLKNVKELHLIARKFIIKRKSKIEFSTVDARPDWTDSVAPPYDIGNCDTSMGDMPGKCNGNNGQPGVEGFAGTKVTLDFGCVNGERNNLEIVVNSGTGSKGQHGSDGRVGDPGITPDPTEKLMLWY